MAEAEYQQLRNAANSSNFKLPEQQAEFLAARNTASAFKNNVLDPAKVAEDDAFSAIQNAKTAINAEKDQGPKTASAGSIQTEGSDARDEGATAQNPPPATLVVKQEDINTPVDIGPAPSTTPSNADTTEPEDVKEKEAPPTIEGGSAATVPPSTSSGTSATPAQNTGSLEPSRQSQATQSYIYKAVDVTHVFDRGRFTQEIHGALMVFPYPPSDAKESTAGNNKQTADEQREEPEDTQDSKTIAGNTPLKKYAQPKTNLSPNVGSKALGINPNAGKSNALAAGLTLPPSSGGQPVAPSFSQDVAQRQQKIITPQQINREP